MKLALLALILATSELHALDSIQSQVIPLKANLVTGAKFICYVISADESAVKAVSLVCLPDRFRVVSTSTNPATLTWTVSISDGKVQNEISLPPNELTVVVEVHSFFSIPLELSALAKSGLSESEMTKAIRERLVFANEKEAAANP